MFRKVVTALALGATVSVVSTVGASATPLDTTGTYPVFNNAGDADLGPSAIVGDTIDYDSVMTVGSVTVDARITVLSVDGTVNFIDSAADMVGPPWPQILTTLELQADSHGGGSVRYRIDFFDHDTDLPVELDGLTATVKDIDENQYFQSNHIATYQLSSTPASRLDVLSHADKASIPSDEYRFDSPTNSMDPTDEDYWAMINFEATDSITIELGQGDYDIFESAWYFVDFAPITWTNTPDESVPSNSGGSGGGSGGSGSADDKLAATGASDGLVTSGALALAALALGAALTSRRSRSRRSA